MLFTDQITWAGERSYYDYGLSIRKPSGDIPAMQTNEVRVPYQQGSYIFTFAFDKRGTFNRRKMVFEFNIEGEDPTDLYEKRTRAIQWLTSNQGGELRLDTIPDAYFKDVYVRIMGHNNTLGRKVATITAEFSCYPFIILDYTHPQYFTGSPNFADKIYYCTAEEIVPCFTCENAMQIKYKNVIYEIPAGSNRYQLTDILFERGNNTFQLKGSGELTVEYFTEVL